MTGQKLTRRIYPLKCRIPFIYLCVIFCVAGSNHFHLMAQSHSAPMNRWLEQNRYQSIISHFEENPPASISDLRYLIPALYEQAYIFSDLFDFSLRIMQDYVVSRDTLSSAYRSPINDFYKGLLLFYRNDVDAAKSYWESFLLNSGEFESLSIIAQAKVSDEKTFISAIYDLMNGTRNPIPMVCEYREPVARDPCLFLQDIFQMQDLTIFKPPSLKNQLAGYTLQIDEFTRLSYHDPTSWYLLSQYRLEQFYQVGINYAPIRQLLQMIDVAWLTGRSDALIRFIENAPENPVHEVYLLANEYRLYQNIDALDELFALTDSENTQVQVYAVRILSELHLDEAKTKKLRQRIAGIPDTGTDSARFLARALVRLGEYEAALERLENHYLRSNHNDLARVRHDMLVLLAHSKYGAGRMYYGESLSHMIALSKKYPVIGVLLPNLQELVIPDCPECGTMR